MDDFASVVRNDPEENYLDIRVEMSSFRDMILTFAYAPCENPPKWVFSKSNFIFPKSNFTIQQKYNKGAGERENWAVSRIL